MFDFWFPKEWSTFKKLTQLKGVGIIGEAIRTITGSIVSFLAKKVTPIISLVVDITPQQSGSGDPSPENIRPITGWTGTNISHWGGDPFTVTKDFKKFTNGSALVFNADGSFTVSASNVAWGGARADPSPTLTVGKRYAISFSFERNSPYFRAGFRSKTTQSFLGGAILFYNGERVSAQSAFGDSGDIIILYPSPIDANNYNFDFVITDSSHKTGSATISNVKLTELKYYSVDWESEAGTVYGGTLTINEDGSATLVSRCKIVSLNGTSSGRKVDSKGSATDLHSYYYQDNTGYRYEKSGFINSSLEYFDYFKCNFAPTMYFPSGIFSYGAYTSSNSQHYLQPRLQFSLASGVDTIAKANDYLKTQSDNGTPVVIAYPLRSPTTYTLTAEQLSTFAGENHIWSDINGEISVTAKGITEITPTPDAALNMLLGGMYTNNHTADDVPDAEALQIILGETT